MPQNVRSTQSISVSREDPRNEEVDGTQAWIIFQRIEMKLSKQDTGI